MELTAAQIARELGLATETVRRWLESGRIPARRDRSGGYRVSEADYLAWLEQWRANPYTRHLHAAKKTSVQ